MGVKGAVLEKYAAKVFKNRKEHMLEIDSGQAESRIAANSRSIPGIMTSRGCCYAGCKGVVLGPLKDALLITHGPVGCGFYSWGTRRNKARAANGGSFIQYCFSTDLQEPDIVFGGEKKLRQAIKEAIELFHPQCVLVCSTCPVGLIGDDIHAVAAESEKLYGITCVAFSCEGYKGVSQSAGHHIANNGVMRRIIGRDDTPPATKFSLNLLGEYNIGGDSWEIERILRRVGYEVVAVLTGDGSFADLSRAHNAALNLVQCHRSINYIAEMMKTRFGMDWIKVNFIGVEAACRSLRDIALYFGDPDLSRRTEEVIADELERIEPDRAHYRRKLKGRTASLYVGGSRSHHYQNLLADFGVSTVLAGYEFAHRDDYEGREVIPDIKEDADNKNIESIAVEKDEKRHRAFLAPERYAELKEKIPLDYYKGMIRDMPDGSVVIDDLNHYETEAFIELLRPDFFMSGIKDKYVIQKAGVPSKQLHSYDYGGPYAGFNGAINFARDIARSVECPAWRLVTPPWKFEAMLEGTVTE
ncbi:MAG: nitrogenase component I subunit alpha [Planctomycetota bacterium]|jgi:nitrogenase molybdenum-iron protein alpha chain|nr:nitrogenase component I subunit alpha [Planctomycetota bacterium]